MSTHDEPDAMLPAYLRHWPGLYVREGDRVVPASAEDSAVAQGYPQWAEKGPLHDGKRLTLLTKKTRYLTHEEVRVLHVVEVAVPGFDVYVMGPKPVYGEYVDGQLATAAPPPGIDPLIPPDYDGATLPSPALDYNYDITTYTFAQAGTHQIQWKLGALESNVLTIEIVAVSAPL